MKGLRFNSQSRTSTWVAGLLLALSQDMWERQMVQVFLSHQCFFVPSPPSLQLSLKSNRKKYPQMRVKKTHKKKPATKILISTSNVNVSAIIIDQKRETERERGGERNINVREKINQFPSICMLTGNQTHNLGMCPKQESNLQPVYGIMLQPTEPSDQGSI